MTATKSGRFRDIIVDCLWESRSSIAVVAVCVVGSTVLSLAAPWPLKLLFDHVLLGKPVPPSLSFLQPVLRQGETSALIWLSLTVIVLAILSSILTFFQILVTSRIGNDIVHRLRSALFDQLQRMSLSFHSRTSSGELMSKLVGDTNTLRDVYSEYLVSTVTHLLTIFGICVVMLMIDYQLALLVMLTFPILFIALIGILKAVRLSARDQRHRESALTSRLSEVLNAMPIVQAFGREAFESERFNEFSAQSKQESMRTTRSEAAAARLVELARAFGTALIIMLGGAQVLRGRISPGDFLVFSTYIINLYKPVRVLARLSSRLFKASASAERVQEILDAEPEIQDAPGAIVAKPLRGSIAFQNVSFAYDNGSVVLDRVSFTISPGKFVALVGTSGSGKSTIASLVLRFYDPTSGRIQIDGIDLQRYQRRSVRDQIGVVLQESLLFGASIAENIAYGKPQASRVEIEHAARQAKAHEFIMGLPDGYDTVLDEGGARLSGGQRQRLCLARALIMNPAILIMDEPTSAVDADAEAHIRTQLREFRRGKTTLLIAHQLQSVRQADHILVLKAGRIVERGTHDQLVRNNGHYCELFQIGRTVVEIQPVKNKVQGSRRPAVG